MKKVFLTIALSILVLITFSQNKPATISPTDTLPYTYLGFGTGINNYVGILGVGADIRVHDKIFIRLGAGLGSWGYKYTAGIRLEHTYAKGWGFGASISFCTGLKNFKTDLETVSGNIVSTKSVTLDLLQARTFNLTASHNWIIGKHNRFFLEFGYAILLDTNPYNVIDGSKLTDNAKTVLKMVQPGGIIIDIGFMFGL